MKTSSSCKNKKQQKRKNSDIIITAAAAAAEKNNKLDTEEVISSLSFDKNNDDDDDIVDLESTQQQQQENSEQEAIAATIRKNVKKQAAAAAEGVSSASAGRVGGGRVVFTPRLILFACCLNAVFIMNLLISYRSISNVNNKMIRNVVDEFIIKQQQQQDFIMLHQDTEQQQQHEKEAFLTSKLLKLRPHPKHHTTYYEQQQTTKTTTESSKQEEEQSEDNIVDKYVHEHARLYDDDDYDPPIYVAIPTVPRQNNPDYLLQSIESMHQKQFPMSNIYVFYNYNDPAVAAVSSQQPSSSTNNNNNNNSRHNHHHHHERWEEAHKIYSHQGVHFLINDSPLPQPIHPASYNPSILPPMKTTDYEDIVNNYTNNNGDTTTTTTTTTSTINDDDETTTDDGDDDDPKENTYTQKWLPQIRYAQKDTLSRKNWRRKECYDFRILSQYMLQNVVYKDVDIYNYTAVQWANNSWIIFNQDDATFNVTYTEIRRMLFDDDEEHNISRYDFFSSGLVSAAFMASALLEILDKPSTWCDFLPVDFMVWAFEDLYDNFKSKRYPEVVNHIGKVSSKNGRVNKYN